MKTQKGFTLIDLMITIVILAILATIAYPNYENYMQAMRLDRARTNVAKITQQLELIYAKQKTFCTGTSPCDVNVASYVDSGTRDVYNISVRGEASNYTIYAEPKNGMYSETTRTNKKVFLVYDSRTTTFARCTSAGLSESKAKRDPGSGCEVM